MHVDSIRNTCINAHHVSFFFPKKKKSDGTFKNDTNKQFYLSVKFIQTAVNKNELHPINSYVTL